MRSKFIKQASIITNLAIYDEILINWFDVRMGISNYILIQCGCFALLIYYYDNITSSSFGLFLLCSFQMASMLSESIKARVELAISMVSVERCTFLNKLAPEQNYKTLDYERKQFLRGGAARMKKLEEYEKKNQREVVVTEGKLSFVNVSARYLSSDKNVLKNLNFVVNPGEKVGVVGRTGSGKSSLIKLIWRYMYPCKGKILIDGKDISKVDLKALRSQIVVISQETALFEGTLRSNLDPSGFLFKDE